MNYLYKISFLAKRPKLNPDKWIKAYRDDNDGWSEEFMAKKGLKPNDAATIANWAYYNQNSDKILYPNDGAQDSIITPNGNTGGWEYYYLPEYDLILAILGDVIKNTDLIEKIKSYIEECYASNNFKEIELDEL